MNQLIPSNLFFKDFFLFFSFHCVKPMNNTMFDCADSFKKSKQTFFTIFLDKNPDYHSRKLLFGKFEMCHQNKFFKDL